MNNTNDMRAAFQDFRDQRNKELAANGLDDQSNFWITNAHYTAWCRGIEWLSQQAQVEPFAYCHLDVNGKASELCSAPCADDDPRDTRTVQALYKHPPAPAEVPEGYTLMPIALTAENGAKALMTGEFYSELVQECDCDGDEECELCNGEGVCTLRVPVSWSTIKNIWRMAVDNLTAAHAPDHTADVRKMVAPDVSELVKAAQTLWRESYNCESDFIQAVVDALSKQEEAER